MSATLDATGSLYEFDLPLLDAETSCRNDRPDTGGLPRAPEITYLVHSEPPAMVALKAKIEQRVHWRVHMPEYLEEVQV